VASLSKELGAQGATRTQAASRKNTLDNFPEPDVTAKKQKSRGKGDATPSELHARMSERQSEAANNNKRDKKNRDKKL
jgi:hypothetical protein